MVFSHTQMIKISLYTVIYLGMALYLLIYKKFELLSIPVIFTIYYSVYIGLCPVFLVMQSWLSPNNQALLDLVNSPLFYNNQCITILFSYFLFFITTILSEKYIFSKKKSEVKRVEKRFFIRNQFAF